MEDHRAIRQQGPAVQHPTVQVVARKHIVKNGVGRIVGDIGVSLRIPLAIIGALAVVVIDHIVGIGYIGAVELPLLGHGQASHLSGRIAEILLRLIPAVKGIAGTVFMRIHLIGCQVTGCHIIGVNLGTDSAVSVDQVIIHRELIPDHADDVGPAGDGDGIAQLVVGISVYILVPAAVVVPAFELIASGELVGLVELVDLQRGQVKGLALAHRIKLDGLIDLAGVAVAVYLYLDGLPVGGVGHIGIGPAVDDGVFCILVTVPIPVIPLVEFITGAVQLHIIGIVLQELNGIFSVEGCAGPNVLGVLLVTVDYGFDDHLFIVGDHADDVGPAVDGDELGKVERVVGISILIAVPAAVIVEALKLVAKIGLIIFFDVQLTEIQRLTLVQIFVKLDGIIGIAGVAVPIDHQHNGIGFALGLEGHFVAGTLGNLPAVVVDKLHRGGGIADVFVLHVELFRKVCHIGISLDGDGAGIAVHGCDVAAYQKFSKCPVMCGMRGLALDIDVDEGIQLLHGGSLRGGNLVGHRVEFDCITAIGNDLRDSHRSIFIRSSVRTIGIPAGDFLISRYRRQIGEGDLSLVIDVIFPVEPAHSTGAGDVAGVSGAAYIFIGNVDIIVLIIRSCERFSIFIICY